jgi:hypothetical protein
MNMFVQIYRSLHGIHRGDCLVQYLDVSLVVVFQEVGKPSHTGGLRIKLLPEERPF